MLRVAILSNWKKKETWKSMVIWNVLSLNLDSNSYIMKNKWHIALLIYLCAKYGALITMPPCLSKDEQYMCWYICLFTAVNKRAPFLAFQSSFIY